MGKLSQLCLNWKVLAVLAVVGVGIWVLAPSLASKAVPLLLLAVCPLSMLLMVWAMRRGTPSMQGAQCSPSPVQTHMRVDGERTHEQKLGALEARQATLQAEQEALAHQIAGLKAASPQVVSEAEAIVQAADPPHKGQQ